MPTFKHTHLYVRWIFLRLLSLSFLFAFLSIATQMLGLYGQHGILPIRNFLAVVSERLGPDAIINFPSIFWMNSSDGFMQVVCSTGIMASLLALAGICTGISLTICWFLYLSIVCVGQTFMAFQWDSLLLETTLLGIWFSPFCWQEIQPFNRKQFEAQKEVSLVFLFLLRFLCFKLMLFSGICKLSSQDPAWHDLTAMTYHYETQPLPPPLAWFMQKLPVWYQKFSTLMVFVLELVMPISLLTFWRPARIVAAIGFIGLMLLIMVTGNYAFFNLLTIALSFTLLDDQALLALLPRFAQGKPIKQSPRIGVTISNSLWTLIPGIVIGICSFSFFWLMVDRTTGKETLPAIAKVPILLSSPLRSFNSYGLFAIMTTKRPEIIVEGSNDGENWIEYEFKFKPGDIKRAPPIVAPHQPRLDWQFWFASLGGTVDQSPWFDSYAKHLLEGTPEVLGLMGKNPFSEAPPKQVRAVYYDYHFSDWDGLFKRGEWWRREKTGEFYPATSLEELQGAPKPADISY